MQSGKQILSDQLNKARKSLRALEKRLQAKGRELDKELLNQAENLFGERKMQAGVLFDVQAQPEQRSKATEPIRADIAQVKKEIAELSKQIESYDKLNSNQLKLV